MNNYILGSTDIEESLLQVTPFMKGQSKVEMRSVLAASLPHGLLTVGPIIRLNCFYYIFAFRLVLQLSCRHRLSLFYLYSEPILRIKAKVNTIPTLFSVSLPLCTVLYMCVSVGKRKKETIIERMEGRER